MPRPTEGDENQFPKGTAFRPSITITITVALATEGKRFRQRAPRGVDRRGEIWGRDLGPVAPFTFPQVRISHKALALPHQLGYPGKN